MNDLIVIVEGETELTFVRDQLAAHLAVRNTNVWPVLPGRHRIHGGVKKWAVARQDIIRTLKESRYCSTMFDFYAMPEDWPGRSVAASKHWHDRARTVERAMHAEISEAMGTRFNPKYFVPYVQLHEFEALTFADVGVLAAALAPLSSFTVEHLEQQFRSILEEAGHPEAINDGRETCPSRRIHSVVPAYRKRALGPIVTNRIGLESIRSRCAHFGKWLARLEQIGSE